MINGKDRANANVVINVRRAIQWVKDEDVFGIGVCGNKVILFESTASTNDIAWEYSTNPKNNGLCVFTEQQTAGRGRRGNTWLSTPAQSILASILLIECKSNAETITLASAVAASQAISSFTKPEPKIKWPNDIMIENKKVAGILVESRPSKNLNNFVIGIGINCHQQQSFFKTNKLQFPSTSIDLHSPAPVGRNSIAANLITAMDNWLQIAKQNPGAIVNRWKQQSSQLGRHITLEYNQKKFSGNCIGVDPTKGLILQLDTGSVRMFDAAHTTIIKQ